MVEMVPDLLYTQICKMRCSSDVLSMIPGTDILSGALNIYIYHYITALTHSKVNSFSTF